MRSGATTYCHEDFFDAMPNAGRSLGKVCINEADMQCKDLGTLRPQFIAQGIGQTPGGGFED